MYKQQSTRVLTKSKHQLGMRLSERSELLRKTNTNCELPPCSEQGQGPRSCCFFHHVVEKLNISNIDYSVGKICYQKLKKVKKLQRTAYDLVNNQLLLVFPGRSETFFQTFACFSAQFQKMNYGFFYLQILLKRQITVIN